MLIQFILIGTLLLAIAVTWRRAKESIIRVSEAVLWTCVWVAAGVVIVLPETTSVLARWLGVGRGVDLVLYASVVTLFLLLFKAFLSIDELEKRLTDLVRRDALRDLEKKDTSVS